MKDVKGVHVTHSPPSSTTSHAVSPCRTRLPCTSFSPPRLLVCSGAEAESAPITCHTTHTSRLHVPSSVPRKLCNGQIKDKHPQPRYRLYGAGGLCALSSRHSVGWDMQVPGKRRGQERAAMMRRTASPSDAFDPTSQLKILTT
eukprot:CAMPEP_0177694410 /NCGR_PEP_ID=MMETSP0484_2-20121128/2918_1 /TAXON_ID=354590 /ORGANISM="Rhodomonas lens, Strain RHODO" /LENGTH=143 /DNA_ID=CAMNT_0019205285 /DNA_START=378 /DNA_END=809 /DNA_ORIENTATION=+